MEKQTNCPMWLKFLDEVLPEKEKQEAIRLFIRAIPNRGHYKMLVLLGDGSNGKSVVMDVIAELFESEVSKVELSELMGKKSDYAINAIDGKKVNLCYGLDGIKSFMFKPILAGERLICRRRYGRPHFTTILPMFICETNNIPSKLSEDIAQSWLTIVRFNIEIDEQDCLLTKKLIQEKQGIMEWADI